MKKILAPIVILALFFNLKAPANAFCAQISKQNLSVNGTPVECEKYNIEGSNYFKLRDIAYLLNGTESQFDVGWNADAGIVSIMTKHAYTTTNGTELVVGEDQSATAKLSSQTIMIDGKVRNDLTVYNIGNSNFFKLRELGDALGFDVDFAENTNTAIVTSHKTIVPINNQYDAPIDVKKSIITKLLIVSVEILIAHRTADLSRYCFDNSRKYSDATQEGISKATESATSYEECVMQIIVIISECDDYEDTQELKSCLYDALDYIPLLSSSPVDLADAVAFTVQEDIDYGTLSAYINTATSIAAAWNVSMD